MPRQPPPFRSKQCRPIDKGIAREVRVLWENGVETCGSCEGGPGHTSPEPVVQFHGDHSEGFRALAIAVRNGLRVSELRRTWSIQDGFPVGPLWELSFLEKEPFGGRKKPGRGGVYR